MVESVIETLLKSDGCEVANITLTIGRPLSCHTRQTNFRVDRSQIVAKNYVKQTQPCLSTTTTSPFQYRATTDSDLSLRTTPLSIDRTAIHLLSRRRLKLPTRAWSSVQPFILFVERLLLEADHKCVRSHICHRPRSSL